MCTSTKDVVIGPLLVLKGEPFARGMLQSEQCPESVDKVRTKVLSLLAENRERFHSTHAKSFIDQQITITRKLMPDIHEEVSGIAHGFGLTFLELYRFYHLRVLLDMDGCTAWAVSDDETGVTIGKNRDLKAKDKDLQRIFVHEDPGWQGRRVLSVGSLGAPCAYSSGINSDGFCLADTNILTSDHGPGICRYFLMPFLLATCRSVEEAIGSISQLPHAGGGSLVMGDAVSEIAAAELGYERQDIEYGGSWLAKTNHFTSRKLSHTNLSSNREAELDNSRNRLRYIEETIPDTFKPFGQEGVLAMMESHSPGAEICRHSDLDESSTISGALFSCRDNTLVFSDGYPCCSSRYGYSL